MSERLLIVKNPNATNARRVDSEVLGRLDDTGVSYEVFHTPTPNYEDNVDAMRGSFREGDRIVVPAGDGTVSQVVDALVRNGNQTAEVAPLAYGGFVDLADKKAGIMDVIGHDLDTQVRFPLAIHVNGELWRHSPGYTTLGFTALAAESFGSPESRARLSDRSSLAKRIGQIAQLGDQYFEHRGVFLPPFHTSTSLDVQRAVTDVLLVNNSRAGGIMRFAQDFGLGDTLGVIERDVSRVLPNIPFGLKALVGRAPASEQREHHISFEETARVPVQTEGEFALLDNVQSISATKDPSISYRVIKPRK